MSIMKWKKKGLLFDVEKYRNDKWLDSFAQAPDVLVFNDFVRVYFSCRPKPDDEGRYISYSAFVDLNRQNLYDIVNISKEPILKLGNPGTFDEFGTYPCSVLQEKNKILCFYAGRTRCQSVPYDAAIGLAISDNGGITFEKIGEGPVLSASPFQPFCISGPKIRKYNGIYYLFYIYGTKWFYYNNRAELITKIGLATSKDTINWNINNNIIINDKLGNNEWQASPDVFYKDNLYHMFFAYMKSPDFRYNHNLSYRIGYAYSTDLINWVRDDDRLNFNVSEDGWDSQMLAYPHVFELDGKIYMLYIGNDVGKRGFGLAELVGNSLL